MDLVSQKVPNMKTDIQYGESSSEDQKYQSKQLFKTNNVQSLTKICSLTEACIKSAATMNQYTSSEKQKDQLQQQTNVKYTLSEESSLDCQNYIDSGIQSVTCSSLQKDFTNHKREIQVFIQNENQKHAFIDELIKKEIKYQDVMINKRLIMRFLRSKERNNSSSDDSFGGSDEDEQDENVHIFFEKEKTEKIMRIVQHYNKKINLLRLQSQDEEILAMMEQIEIEKLKEIQKIELECDQLKKIRLPI